MNEWDESSTELWTWARACFEVGESDDDWDSGGLGLSVDRAEPIWQGQPDLRSAWWAFAVWNDGRPGRRNGWTEEPL